MARAQVEDETRTLPATIALIRGDNAQILGDLSGTVRYTELALQLAPEDDLFLRAHAAITLGFTRWATGDLEAALRALYAWMDDMEKMGNREFVIASAFAAADWLESDLATRLRQRADLLEARLVDPLWRAFAARALQIAA